MTPALTDFKGPTIYICHRRISVSANVETKEDLIMASVIGGFLLLAGLSERNSTVFYSSMSGSSKSTGNQRTIAFSGNPPLTRSVWRMVELVWGSVTWRPWRRWHYARISPLRYRYPRLCVIRLSNEEKLSTVNQGGPGLTG